MIGPNAVLFVSDSGCVGIVRWGALDTFRTQPPSRTLSCAMTLHHLNTALEEYDAKDASISAILIASGCAVSMDPLCSGLQVIDGEIEHSPNATEHASPLSPSHTRKNL